MNKPVDTTVATLTGAEAVVEMLKAHGVEIIFGLCGDTSLPLYDAHNHLQDGRLAPHGDAVAEAAFSAGVVRMVVNGSCESDWLAVLELARGGLLVFGDAHGANIAATRAPEANG